MTPGLHIFSLLMDLVKAWGRLVESCHLLVCI